MEIHKGLISILYQDYFAIGAKLTNEINKDLYKLEPYDIHMILQL